MDMICKAKHTENDDFYCIVSNEEDYVFALTDEEIEDDNFKFPRVNSCDLDDIKGKYKHFKDKNYEVLGTCFDSIGEKYVFYKALYDIDIKYYIRPYDMFFSKVDKEKYPDVVQEYRFEKMD